MVEVREGPSRCAEEGKEEVKSLDQTGGLRSVLSPSPLRTRCRMNSNLQLDLLDCLAESIVELASVRDPGSKPLWSGVWF